MLTVKEGSCRSTKTEGETEDLPKLQGDFVIYPNINDKNKSQVLTDSLMSMILEH